MYVLYRLHVTTTVIQNMSKTSSSNYYCMVKEVQPWFACPRIKVLHCN